jgi:hypothetical protein
VNVSTEFVKQEEVGKTTCHTKDGQITPAQMEWRRDGFLDRNLAASMPDSLQVHRLVQDFFTQDGFFRSDTFCCCI